MSPLKIAQNDSALLVCAGPRTYSPVAVRHRSMLISLRQAGIGAVLVREDLCSWSDVVR